MNTLSLAALTFANLLAAPSAAVVPSDVLNGYAEILKTHVKDGLVDYKRIEKNEKAKLEKFITALAEAKLPEDRDARVAFYIDAYNALVIAAVIREGRPRSVLDVKGFFNEKKHTVAGRTVTLDELEKKILNPLAQDPRTHMVLVCAAVGCPVIENVPYQGSDLSARMDAAARRYLASRHGAVVKPEDLALSRIFDWYKADFGGDAGVLEFARRYLPADAKAKLGASPKVSYLEYNWTLNQQ
jgi:DNA-binding Lrp family transcriptional regulator